MREYIGLIYAYRLLTCSLLTIAFVTTSCRKEAGIEPSRQDENYFVIQDNPNDPIDHAIYQFYESTGIPSYYNDTIHRRRIADSAGIPRYAYIKVSTSYSLFGNSANRYKLVSAKSSIPPLLDLLRTKLLPRIPNNMHLSSILFVDSIWNETPLLNIQMIDGWASLQGFNTVAMIVKDAAGMNEDEQKMYMASILAGLAHKRISNLYPTELQQDFFSISRIKGASASPYDIYMGVPFKLFGDPTKAPAPEKIGFLKYVDIKMLAGTTPLDLMTPPRELDDLRAYLFAMFYYSTEEFTAKYATEALVLQKFSIIKKLVTQEGFLFLK